MDINRFNMKTKLVMNVIKTVASLLTFKVAMSSNSSLAISSLMSFW